MIAGQIGDGHLGTAVGVDFHDQMLTVGRDLGRVSLTDTGGKVEVDDLFHDEGLQCGTGGRLRVGHAGG
ncbi:hypothetical protein ACWDUN_03130 [Mycobacterium sp. NPDC003323]